MRTTMKCPLRTVTVVMAVLLAYALPVPALPVSAADSDSIVIIASPTDGHVRINGDAGWDALRASGESSVFDDLRYVKINTRPDVIYRGFLFFDTSALPDILATGDVRLHIYAKCTGDLDDSQLYILTCPPGFPQVRIRPWPSQDGTNPR